MFTVRYELNFFRRRIRNSNAHIQTFIFNGRAQQREQHFVRKRQQFEEIQTGIGSCYFKIQFIY